MSVKLKVVFILSAPRSGSTWLNLVLGSHSWAFNLGEYYRPFTMPGHVACRLCEADGLSDCAVLHGIENVTADDSFQFASERSCKHILIDASKRIDWVERFIGRDDIDAKLIHLVRNPCGFVESEGRRQVGLSDADLLGLWRDFNESIENFISSSGNSSILVSYDHVAENSAAVFPEICEYIGESWEPAALQYWLFPHHGLGANGAASVYLRGRIVERYTTGDDDFYRDIVRRPVAADSRWKAVLDAQRVAAIKQAPYVNAMRSRLGLHGWD